MKKILPFLPDLLLIAGFGVTAIIEAVALGFTPFFFIVLGITLLLIIQLQFRLQILGAVISAALLFVSGYFLMAFFSDVVKAAPLSIHQLKGTIWGFLLIGSVITLSLLSFIRNIRSRS